MLARPVPDRPRGSDVATVASELQHTLGQRLTAYAVGLRNPEAIGSYARHEATPEPRTAGRLLELHSITQHLASRESAETTRAWMVGASPLLDHRAPVELLHEQARTSRAAALRERCRRLMARADAFRRVDDAARMYIGHR
jgi:hypothetical protein